MLERIDETRLEGARRTCGFLVARVRDDGRFHPPDALFAETSGYQAELAATLAVAGKLLEDSRCTETSRRMFYRLLDSRVEGLWSLDWWWDYPVKIAPPENWKKDNVIPNARYTAITLFSLALYHRATEDNSILEPARDAMAMMFRRWDFMRGNFVHLTAECAALAAHFWEHALPEFASHKEPIIGWVVKTFEEMAPCEFPFFTAIRTMLLLAASGTRYLESTIRPGIDALLSEPQWRFPHNANDFRHIMSTDDHVNTRGNTAMALTFRMFDLAAGDEHYTATPLYSYPSTWIDGMRDPDGGYYEGKDIATGRRLGRGSPAHYLPLWWTFGGLAI